MWMDGSDTSPQNRPHRQDGRRHDQRGPRLDGLFTVVLVLALAAVFASPLPGPLVAPMMSSLLQLTAFTSAIFAALRSEHAFADRITSWDQAAMFLFLSTFCALFTDEVAAAEAIAELAQTAPGGAL